MGCLVEQIWHGNPAAFRAVDRRGGRFRAYVPYPLTNWHPPIPADAAASIAAAERDLRDTAEATASKRGEHGMFFWAESLGSSRIEGVMPGTKRVVHALARRQRGFNDEPPGPVAEVIANIDAVNEALTLLADRDNFSVDTIRQAHRVLMDASPTPHLGGKIRDDQNWVGGSDWHPLNPDTFVPPPAANCGPLLDDLAAYIRNDDHSPVLQAAIAHAQFETIHPFGDGNGRTGRAILYAALKHRLGLSDRAVMPPVSLALSRDRDKYLGALTTYQTYTGPADGTERADGLIPLVESLATASHRACQSVRVYCEAVGQMQNHWRAVVGGRRGRSVISEAIDCLPSHPSLTPPALSKLTGYTEARCAAALRRLEEAHILKTRTVGPNSRVYDCDKVFDAYEIMASTVCDQSASISDYDIIIANPFVAPKIRR
ncbi:MAG: Fic family protein [Acidimicrobiia bacterium]|nr:Fic family protein [Acidimicrobiia bacterium]MYC58017.1 Fic family protein [Acidimicrobiia bacterium]MYI30810.1 Fic family protein [Acidimicrobiia bacterium]